jgi:N-acetylmuramoyl-L-alanine amidase
MISPTHNNNKQKDKNGTKQMVTGRGQRFDSSHQHATHSVYPLRSRGRISVRPAVERGHDQSARYVSPRRRRANWVAGIAGLITLIACAQPSLTDEQQVLALTLLAEARGEGVQGMEAVAMVVKQRMVNRSQTAKQVCLAPKQFSAWNGRSKSDLEYLWRSPAASDAVGVVRRFSQLDPADIGHADHYCTVQITPYWALNQQPVAVIGNHKFYRLKD